MSDSKEKAIEVLNLSKEYEIFTKEDISSNGVETFFALKNISFTVDKGDVLGIIGNNGSGKTTLLKILSQISKPTSGEARFYGSATSILYIGSNFHPELTGRQNATIHFKLGKVPVNQYQLFYNKIIKFSELGNFFDQPVKFYSNGMFLRLAFSLAFYGASEILILDEVLSVGDEGFRLKCQDMLQTFAKSGKSILFVSHNRMEILELSNKCMWLEKGEIKKTGIPSIILAEYFAQQRDNFDGKKLMIESPENNSTSENESDYINLIWDSEQAPGNDIIGIRQLSVVSGVSGKSLYCTEPIEITFIIHKKRKGIKIGAFFFIQDIFYQPVLVGHFLNNIKDEDMSGQLINDTGLIEIKCIIPGNFLEPGKYYLLPRFGMEEGDWNPSSSEAFRFSEKLYFNVKPDAEYIDFVGDFSKGAIRPPLDWKIKKAE